MNQSLYQTGNSRVLKAIKTKSKEMIRKPKHHRYTLYEKAVMSPDSDVDFMIRSFKKIRNRKPTLFREDFCQTALLACEWAKRNPSNHAWAIDLDPVPLEWGKKYNVASLGDKASRVSLVQEDVLTVDLPAVDIVCGLNFSYFFMKTRKDLLRYFRSVLKGLKKDGIFYLDILGGPDVQEPGEDRSRVGSFSYIWDQDKFNPINHDFLCYIHFKLRNGKMMRKAFTYDWRLWSISEVQDILLDAGFSDVRIYWEDEDEDGDGTGTFRWRKKAQNTISWVAYIVALK